ncbi:bifunctional [glutamine synthetase] adenylyltransferase/[glutamine synthetase]-adenylyl-L-tyrosine phosphorylase [Palleronia sediminis]|uniref:Bifunctional [glutamine synthetase] adenylyltransferase/[glutamine synthetase]-adenylyl-L-tyrosine phosphorylase n=1 Tax=Palleronia sediminis TaxID=2547833 RepID=A0A4R6ALI3_9RHOB|nr:bifunctional [glutamine synthetase] adenylyltransferase/[glutamine synthetase]-adenylyl-L-tyrosine phosphorylase [Palleronia sediminis]TDL84285.1 bifunctional [glutamine synthetase] adenylyltransferase/[glutamine synthetase]-adenylyl-L-tyrosine phosphorylase [Palleronia sediminis]
MSLVRAISRSPRPFDAERAAEIASAFSGEPPEARDLLAGIAGCAPYLRDLMNFEAEWLRGALGDDPHVRLQQVLSETAAAPDDALPRALRQAKRRVALLAAVCDCGGVWGLEDVTGALTRLADLATGLAVRREVGTEIRRGRLPGRTEDDLETGAGLVAIAMGKMGAFELNYSSDIDLIVLFDEELYGAEAGEARASLVKATRRMCSLLSDTGPEGYVFRTDLRLRPDPSVTPVCIGMDAAERYYEAFGRTWERAAWIKGRPAAGDIAAGERFLDRLAPFTWRRHLDFAAIEDAHAIRLRIRDHKGLGGPIALPGHDMKLGRGGIREIEFFTQTRQIIAGGRDPSLRVRGTIEALAQLVRAGWVPDDTARQLTEDYRAHREVEHRLQMIADQQTHDLPASPEGFARLAAFLDRDETELRAELRARLDRVSGLTEGFFSPARPAASDMPELDADRKRLVQSWRGYPALRSERALDIFDRIKPAVLTGLLASPRPDRALLNFDGFLRGLPAGVQLFSLFEANPHLTALIVDIAGSSAELAEYLSRNAAVLDAVIGGDFFTEWPGLAALETGLAQRLEARPDYERKLDEARSWMRDWHFRIGVHHLRGIATGDEAGRQYAELAEAAIAALWPVVVAEFATRHGPPPGTGAMVLAMGSLGAGHLTARSDLDLIVIYDAAGVDASEGRRPLSSGVYYARLTQSLVTALTAPTAQGRLYEVDMRLRPSGKQGPVATALGAFERYQREDAWTWEHLALTRGRAIAGPPALCEAVEGLRSAIIAGPRDAAAARADTAAMRDRLRGAKPGGPWDAKAGPGRLAEIELAASLLGLLARSGAAAPGDQIAAGREAGLIGADAARRLEAARGLLARFQDAKRLLGANGFDPETLGAGALAMILRETGARDMDGLARDLAHAADGADAIITELLR